MLWGKPLYGLWDLREKPWGQKELGAITLKPLSKPSLDFLSNVPIGRNSAGQADKLKVVSIRAHIESFGIASRRTFGTLESRRAVRYKLTSTSTIGLMAVSKIWSMLDLFVIRFVFL